MFQYFSFKDLVVFSSNNQINEFLLYKMHNFSITWDICYLYSQLDINLIYSYLRN